MTADELKALAERLRDHASWNDDADCREDARAAAQIIEQQAEPVAIIRTHRTGGNAGIAWSGVPIHDGPMLDGTPLYLHPPPPADQTAGIERLLAEVEALRSDAGRLHWLEQQSGHCGISVRDHDGTVLYGAGISDAIDAARAAQPCNQPEGGR